MISRPRYALFFQRLLAIAVAAGLAVPAPPAAAQSKPMPIVRDAEIEALLRDYAAPIFRAARVDGKAAQIVLINDRSFNAFVANGQRIFLNVGAIMDAQTPNELIGVLAHETGHIAGGHLARLRQEIAKAQILSAVGMVLGAGAAVGAARAGSSVGGAGTGAMGVLGGGQELVLRNLLSYQRTEEQAADQAAVRYLNATGQSPQGMITTFRRFAESGLFRTTSLDPYLLSHPLPTERISQLERLAAASPHLKAKDPPALQARHDLARAKLFGFVERPATILRRYPPSDASAPGRYARAILAHRSGRLSDALAQIDQLIAGQPNNPYFHELRGQVLLESGRAREAVAPLRRAVQLAPTAAPIRVLLGQSLLGVGDGASIDEAIRQLSNAAQREPEAADVFRHLSMAYGRKGNIAQAELAIAQAYINSGDFLNARTQAHRAMSKLPKGSPGYLKAADIYNHQPPR